MCGKQTQKSLEQSYILYLKSKNTNKNLTGLLLGFKTPMFKPRV